MADNICPFCASVFAQVKFEPCGHFFPCVRCAVNRILCPECEQMIDKLQVGGTFLYTEWYKKNALKWLSRFAIQCAAFVFLAIIGALLAHLSCFIEPSLFFYGSLFLSFGNVTTEFGIISLFKSMLPASFVWTMGNASFGIYRNETALFVRLANF